MHPHLNCPLCPNHASLEEKAEVHFAEVTMFLMQTYRNAGNWQTVTRKLFDRYTITKKESSR